MSPKIISPHPLDPEVRAAQARDEAVRKQAMLIFRETLQARHAAELSRAGLIERLRLRWRMLLEEHREWKRLSPSPLRKL